MQQQVLRAGVVMQQGDNDDPRRQPPLLRALQIADDLHLEHTRALVEGHAVISKEAIPPVDDPWLQELVNTMARRYMGPDGPQYAVKTLDRPRVLIMVTPEKIQSWTGGEWAERYWR